MARLKSPMPDQLPQYAEKQTVSYPCTGNDMTPHATLQKGLCAMFTKNMCLFLHFKAHTLSCEAKGRQIRGVIFTC